MLSAASVYNGGFIPSPVLIKHHFLSYCIFNENCCVILPQSACGSNLLRLSLCVFLSRDSEGRKLCKKVKVDPSSRPGGAELLHYKSVAANPFPLICPSSSPVWHSPTSWLSSAKATALQRFPESRLSAAPRVFFRDGTFHTEYNRPATFKVSSFLFLLYLHSVR